MSKYTQMHQILGISEDRENELTKEIMRVLSEHETIQDGIKDLAKAYDAETIFVGVKLFQILTLNAEATKAQHTHKGAILGPALRNQNAPLN